MDRFGVSIKGVIEIDGKLLLRKNERCEYELLGGRLEKGDASAEFRLITEFKEESGIKVEVLGFKEPWLYEIGLKNIIIVPFICKALSIPDILIDEDGGTLHWVDKNEVETVFMPQGYKDTISGKIPHKSYSIPAKSFFKIIPNYVERDYYVEVNVKENDTELIQLPLPHFYSPRDFIFTQLGEKYKNANLVAEPIGIDYENDKIVLNYKISL
ncbi:MAG: hypothetical protein NC240_01195 [Clostridium sp.]|nr:hypothetical protein [Clostridium sp.]